MSSAPSGCAVSTTSKRDALGEHTGGYRSRAFLVNALDARPLCKALFGVRWVNQGRPSLGRSLDGGWFLEGRPRDAALDRQDGSPQMVRFSGKLSSQSCQQANSWTGRLGARLSAEAHIILQHRG